MEIERRFLIKDITKLDLSKYQSKRIIQDYLYKDNFTAIRKRQTIKNNEIIYTYTVKTNKIGLSVNEIEQIISFEQYNNLQLNPKFNHIDKTRYLIPYKDNLTIELDVFNDNFSGIIFAEIEFTSEEQANTIELPIWLGPEISNKLTNSDIASKPIEKIFTFINSIN